MSWWMNPLRINTEFISQLEIFIKMKTRAITAKRPNDNFFDELSSNQSMVPEKLVPKNHNKI